MNISPDDINQVLNINQEIWDRLKERANVIVSSFGHTFDSLYGWEWNEGCQGDTFADYSICIEYDANTYHGNYRESEIRSLNVPLSCLFEDDWYEATKKAVEARKKQEQLAEEERKKKALEKKLKAQEEHDQKEYKRLQAKFDKESAS